MHAYEMHAHEVYPREMHACEVHAYEVYPMRCTPAHEVHAHETHAYEMHARKVHAYETSAHETPAHHCFGGSLAQKVVDLLRSGFQNTSFCASCGVVPIALRRSPPFGAKSNHLVFHRKWRSYLYFKPDYLSAKSVSRTLSKPAGEQWQR
jgi:hypothetical protein